MKKLIIIFNFSLTLLPITVFSQTSILYWDSVIKEARQAGMICLQLKDSEKFSCLERTIKSFDSLLEDSSTPYYSKELIQTWNEKIQKKDILWIKANLH